MESEEQKTLKLVNEVTAKLIAATNELPEQLRHLAIDGLHTELRKRESVRFYLNPPTSGPLSCATNGPVS